MSPITLVKHVKLTLQPSFHFFVTAYACFSLLLWAVASSAIPLVASVVCCAIVWQYCTPARMFHSALLGDVRIVPEQRLIECERVIAYQKVDLTYAAVLVIFTESSTQKWLLWRDACHEKDYRQLLASLKREQQGSRSSL